MLEETGNKFNSAHWNVIDDRLYMKKLELPNWRSRSQLLPNYNVFTSNIIARIAADSGAHGAVVKAVCLENLR